MNNTESAVRLEVEKFRDCLPEATGFRCRAAVDGIDGRLASLSVEDDWGNDVRFVVDVGSPNNDALALTNAVITGVAAALGELKRKHFETFSGAIYCEQQSLGKPMVCKENA